MVKHLSETMKNGSNYDEPGMFDPEGREEKLLRNSREEHKARRGVQGAKFLHIR